MAEDQDNTESGTAEWRDVPGFEGFYQVSSYGAVRSLTRPGTRIKGQPIKPWVALGGYLRVRFYVDYVRTVFFVHRLVLLAFVGHPPEPRSQCCHADRNRTNNHVSNLRWGSCTENQRDRIAHGTSNRGELSVRAILSEESVRKIIRLKATSATAKEVAAAFGVKPSCIRSIWYRTSWRHLDLSEAEAASLFTPRPSRWLRHAAIVARAAVVES